MASPVADSYAGPSGGVIAGGRYRLPEWRRAMAPRTWHAFGNTLNDINPRYRADLNPNYPNSAPWDAISGFTSVCSTWNGAVWDEDELRLVFPFCGGHADYAGNQTMEWDAYSGQFSILIPPTGSIGNTGTLNDGLESTGVYFDGQPRSYHTYGNIAMRNGEVWCFGGSIYVTGVSYNYPFRLPPGATAWIKDSVSADGNGTSSSVVYDPVRDRFWYLMPGTSRPTFYDPVTHGKTVLTNAWLSEDGVSVRAAYDPVRDLVLRLGQNLTLLTLGASPAPYLPPVTGSRPAPLNGVSTKTYGNEGFVYDSRRDRFLLWDGGTSIYVLTPPASNPLTNTWAWSELIPNAANTVDPGIATYNGVQGRFWYSHKLDACGVVNSVTQQMHVFALD